MELREHIVYAMWGMIADPGVRELICITGWTLPGLLALADSIIEDSARTPVKERILARAVVLHLEV